MSNNRPLPYSTTTAVSYALETVNDHGQWFQMGSGDGALPLLAWIERQPRYERSNYRVVRVTTTTTVEEVKA